MTRSPLAIGLMVRCYAAARRLGADAKNIEDAAVRITRFLYDELTTTEGERSAALARFFLECPYGELDGPRRAAVNAVPGISESPHMRCLSLVATFGEEPAWNDPETSRGHLAIPIESKERISKMPMLAKLLSDLRFEPGAGESGRAARADDVGIFYIENAKGSPYIPNQTFVERHGIVSVLAFGATLPNGRLFFLVLFSKAPIPTDARIHFELLSLGVKSALLPFLPAGAETNGIQQATEQARISTLERLLAAQEQLAVKQAEHIGDMFEKLRVQSAELTATVERVNDRNRALEELHRTIEDLSTPILEVWKGVLVLPLIGAVDERRGEDAITRSLEAVASTGARMLILDVTGVAHIDGATAERLLRLVRAVELIGASCILTGVQPDVAATLATLGVDLGALSTRSTVKSALERILAGRRIR